MSKTPAHVIEERMKKEGTVVRDYIQESIRNLSVCYFCKKELQNTSYKCKWCLHNFCSEHKTPQGHKCPAYFSRMAKGRKPSESSLREHSSVLRASKRVRSPVSMKAILIIISLIVLVGSFLVTLSNYDFSDKFMSQDNELKYVNVTKIVLINETIIEDVPDRISYESYLNNVTFYDGMHEELIGFLSYNLETDKDDSDEGQYVEKIVDDHGQEIRLVGLEPQDKKYFALKEVSKELYAVNGTFERRYKDIQFRVAHINPASRPNKTIEKTITKEKEIIVEKLVNSTA